MTEQLYGYILALKDELAELEEVGVWTHTSAKVDILVGLAVAQGLRDIDAHLESLADTLDWLASYVSKSV